MRRVAQVLAVRPELLDEYRELHRAVPEPVLDRIRRSRISTYSIHLLGDRLFSYFEYHGDDLAGDLAAMAEDEATRRWWQLTAPCQVPVPEAAPGEWWATAERVFLME
ncbi:L-rhamnose mutarotase [Streptomyces sp. 3213]|uniref:L-rhamnose mutarotase n=1 Tax=Streptomyces sp. 3213.3 TaxID=1855348 RepID=UPI0008945FE7|nr:L-rhamnose mutarotase [Streptomyces sp. 3213.3]SEE87692.1 L-rhamnose mutarotase [Streptomyces sp. 3213] [Streptomyces sp. 3213.3]